MTDKIIIGRQPVFNKNYSVVGYEILFRGEMPTGGVDRTAQVVVNTLIDLGLDKVAGSLPVFFNIDEAFLLNGIQLAEALPPEQVHFEILETVPPSEAVLQACRALKSKGYSLALDDVTSIEAAKPFIDIVDIIKLDWLATADPLPIMREFRRSNVRFLAEKIDSYEAAEAAKAMNFDLFQGFFYCHPEIVSGNKPPESRMSILRAMQQAMVAASIDQMFTVIKQDVTLSYRLLKYINSASFGLKREVQSIEQALALLGLRNIRRWLTLLTMTSLAENKPPELVRQAMYRARFLEMLAKRMGEDVIDDDFLLGLFSILDALLDCTMQDSLKEISLAQHVQSGLLDLNSPMGQKLAVCLSLEQGNWDYISKFTENGRRIDYREINMIQTDAMQWADQQMAVLSTL
ncbi:EAL and HDOD domain-containing protein [Mariprofundus erugo]|nr:HDOD domain-containing protein [Mariprofundus erugo]